jgi:hypothetical protein
MIISIAAGTSPSKNNENMGRVSAVRTGLCDTIEQISNEIGIS